jgi:hypothetical protein
MRRRRRRAGAGSPRPSLVARRSARLAGGGFARGYPGRVRHGDQPGPRRRLARSSPAGRRAPPTARALWAMVDALCAADPHLGVTSFVDHAAGRTPFPPPRWHARATAFGGGRGRLRRYRTRAGGDGVQAVLQLQPGRRGAGRQIEPCRECACSIACPRACRSGRSIRCRPCGSAVVEIYTTLAALAAGRSAGSIQNAQICQPQRRAGGIGQRVRSGVSARSPTMSAMRC